jgi:hypothetical protein
MGTARGGQEWKTGCDSWVRTIKDKQWVAGLWLGEWHGWQVASTPQA